MAGSTKKKTATKAVEDAAPEVVEETAQEESRPFRIEGRRMYVGPTITAIGFIRNAVYTEVPEKAYEVRESVPDFLNLFIPVEQFGDADYMIRKETGYIFTAYKHALEFKSNKGG